MLRVALLIAVSSYEVFIWFLHSFIICAHELICICGILRGIFVVGTYMLIPCKVDIAVGCVLVHICKNIGSTCPM